MQISQQPGYRAPHDKEIEVLFAIRQILGRSVTTYMQIDGMLPRQSLEMRETVGALLNVFEQFGEEAFWQSYEGFANCYPPFAHWKPLLTMPLVQQEALSSTLESAQTVQVPLSPHPAPPPQTPRRAAILLSEVQEREVSWLWKPRIPLGKITMLDGDPGQGKSMLTLDLAARVSRGWIMPDETAGTGQGAGVILIAPEDDLGDTIRPRLRRAGADLDRVASLGTIPVTDPSTGYSYERPFSLIEDLSLLEQTIEKIDAQLVIIDPVMALMGGKDTYRDNEVRMLLTPLQRLLEKKRVACLVVRHLTKGSGGSNALYRGSGSIAFIALARSSLMVIKDPYDEQKSLLLHTKSNLERTGPILCFSVQRPEPPDDPRPHVCWHGERNYTAQELAGVPSTPRESSSRVSTARDEILRVLEEHSPDALSPTNIAKELPDMSLNTIKVTLTRMLRDGQVEQPDQGKYGVLSN